MFESLSQVQRHPLPTGPRVILPGSQAQGGPTRKVYLVKLLRTYLYEETFETIGFKARTLPEAQAYVRGLSYRVREECPLARIYECDNPRLSEMTGTIKSQGTATREVPGLRLIEECQWQEEHWTRAAQRS